MGLGKNRHSCLPPLSTEKAPGRKQAVASYPKRSVMMDRLGLSSRKPHLARRTSSEHFFFPFFFFSLFYLRIKEVLDTATHEHTAGARGYSLQTELMAAQAHREPNSVSCSISQEPSLPRLCTMQSSSAEAQWPRVGCGGARSRWAPPALNCDLYW